MRRLSRLLALLGAAPGLTVVEALLEKPATQKQLLVTCRKARVPVSQGTMTPLMQRLEDLGLVTRANQKAPYVLQQPDEVATLLLHLAALGLAMGREESGELKAIEDVARRAKLRLVAREEGDLNMNKRGEDGGEL